MGRKLETFSFMGETYGLPTEHEKYTCYTPPDHCNSPDLVVIELEVLDSHPEIRKRGLKTSHSRLINGFYSSQQEAIDDFYSTIKKSIQNG